MDLQKHIIDKGNTIQEALKKLNGLKEHLVLFATEENGAVVGSITDGDIRRGLLLNLKLESKAEEVMFKRFNFFYENKINLNELKNLKSKGIFCVPVLVSGFSFFLVVFFFFFFFFPFFCFFLGPHHNLL